MFATFRQIINEVLTEAGLVPGLGVQQYTEPQIRLAVNRIFDFLMNKTDRWEHLSEWTVTTVGEGGIVAGDLTTIVNFSDVYEIRRVDDDMPIIRATGRDHLYSSGNVLQYWSSLVASASNYETKKIQFWPKEARGQVAISALRRPKEFRAEDDIVPFDKSIVVLGAAWYLVQGDGMNAGQAEKLKNMFDIFYADYVAKLGTRDIGPSRRLYDGRTVTIQQP